MTARPSLVTDRCGSTGAEFAMVLPLLVILLFAIIDGGRFVWEYNRAEKATQVGSRMAVVTDIISTGLRDNDYVGIVVDGETVDPGERIPTGALGSVLCNDTGCTCTGACTGVGAGYNAAAFANLVDRMNDIKPDITAANVEVVYSGSGLGYAGDPTGMSMSPLVTVRLKGLQFQPITALLLASFTMPSFTTTLTAEDSVGSYSN
jgi:Flp pilus assembly protein TadG